MLHCPEKILVKAQVFLLQLIKYAYSLIWKLTEFCARISSRFHVTLFHVLLTI